MIPEFSKIKGIPPSAILKRELKNRNIKSKELADSIGEHKQTISAILNGRRGINPSLSIKLGHFFNIDEDYFLLLQASYDVKKIKQKEYLSQKPNLKLIRKSLFWDTDFDNIDWQKNKRAVIKRIFERGNEQEIKAILSFYTKKIVVEELKTIKGSFLPSFQENVTKYAHL